MRSQIDRLLREFDRAGILDEYLADKKLGPWDPRNTITVIYENPHEWHYKAVRVGWQDIELLKSDLRVYAVIRDEFVNPDTTTHSVLLYAQTSVVGFGITRVNTPEPSIKVAVVRSGQPVNPKTIWTFGCDVVLTGIVQMLDLDDEEISRLDHQEIPISTPGNVIYHLVLRPYPNNNE